MSKPSAVKPLSFFTEQLRTLHQMNLELSRVDSFDEMCRQAVLMWRDKLKMGRLGVWMICPGKNNHLCGVFGIDEKGEIRDERGQSFENDAPIFLEILRHQQLVYYEKDHVLLNHRSQPIARGETAAAALWDGDQVLGFVVTDNLLSNKPITQTDRQLLYLFGQMLGHLISQKRAEKIIRENERRYRLLNEISQIIIGDENNPNTLQLLASRFAQLLNATHCHLILWDETTQTAAGWANSQDTRSPPTLDEISFVGSALKAGTPQIYRAQHPGKGISGEFLALPLIANQQPLGAILLDAGPHQSWDENQVKTGEEASRQIALALLKARLFEQTQRQLRETETLRESGIAVASALKQDEAIERILEELNRVVPYDSATVQIRQEEYLIVVGARGFANPQDILGLKFPLQENTLTHKVVKQKMPYILDDAPLEYPHFREGLHKGIHGWMGVPIVLKDRVIGKLTLDSHQPFRFTQAHARLATAFAAHVAITLENARLFNEVERLATHDFLTGVYNRRYFMDLAQHVFLRAARYQESMAIILFDLDHFKGVNDTYGHLAGDQVLQIVAETCQKQLRSSDLLARYGGEEFVILFSNPPAYQENNSGAPVQAAQIAERLRKAVSRLSISHTLGEIKPTISLGVANRVEQSEGLEQLINYADIAMYQSKRNGRNRVTVYEETEDYLD